MHNLLQAQEIFLGLKLILDKRQHLVAYELLFSSGELNAVHFLDNTQATSQAINDAFSQFEIGEALAVYECLIKVRQELLMSDAIEILSQHRVTLELLETGVVDLPLIERCRELKEMGFDLALDDYVNDGTFDPLLDVVDIVKIDITLQDWPSTLGIVNKLRNYPVRLLAEKVESHEQYLQCAEAGFDLFQGYYFARPNLAIGKCTLPNQAIMLKLLGLILTDAPDHEIEQVLKQDAGLSLKLLRLVNSVSMGLKTKISSFNQSIKIVGRRQMQRWLQLLLYTPQQDDVSYSPLLRLAARRGKLMESLAQKCKESDRDFHDRAFMTGILSLLDALLNRPLMEVIDLINPADEIADALLNKSGNLGGLLSLAEMTEQGRFDHAGDVLESLGLAVQDLMGAEVDALRWSNSITTEMAQ
ncbi:diguanylate phosphodiesterase metal dependent hydrolase domain-containing protein [Sulfuricella denitrificans skB26]|uniref:Diguanylate phosphodiesterase metal dependent hydrolase domain-containing protein n=1 Tax=Sulfuricella denitrificans (strain DSM 22764 / NBRC 105220 / skB26) TaxID=1163617 RepID=S6AK12_SULDS|nr:EAL domain-containing protein [Sulfuricella denitrificans]BAN34924.1 diguanylate phosphodiesterase metal dependent hydrolase domain-containing protein [Sulfuricella denitrificans skB26]